MDADTEHKTDRFTPLIVFASDHDFPTFAAERNINYKSVMGLYRGKIENSFVIDHADGWQTIKAGLLAGQESVLILLPQEPVYGGQRDVWLVGLTEEGWFDNQKTEYLGHWHKVSIDEALHSDAWTCYPADNAWYVTKLPETEW